MFFSHEVFIDWYATESDEYYIVENMVRTTDFSFSACRGRATALGVATGALWKRRWTNSSAAFSSTPVLLYLADKISSEIDEEHCILVRYNRISLADFFFNFCSTSEFRAVCKQNTNPPLQCLSSDSSTWRT